MNPLKQLASQTATYGLSSIIGRILSYLLVPLYTRVIEDQSDYGIMILLYSFIAIMIVILTYGMETGFFRYASTEKNKSKVYSTAFISILISTTAFLIIALFGVDFLAVSLKLGDYSDYLRWIIIILALDVFVALPYAKLRNENRAARFASIKIVNIFTNIGLNLFFILLCPFVIKNYPESGFTKLISYVFDHERSLVEYVFIANVISSLVQFILLLPAMFKIKLSFDAALWRKLFAYSFPLIFAGLAGIMNETAGRIMINYLLPEDIAAKELGVYGTSYKVAMLLYLFIQAFRYAAEPFFFEHAQKKDARKVYADILNYFVIATAVIFLGITLYKDIVINLMLGENYREAVGVIPILLFGFIFLGIYYNLSVWFKLTNLTRYGAYMAFFGAFITIVMNYFMILEMGYLGSAWTTFACYFAMMLLSIFLGRKHFKINYNWRKVVFYLVLMTSIFAISEIMSLEFGFIQILIHTILLILFIGLVVKVERKYLRENYFR